MKFVPGIVHPAHRRASLDAVCPKCGALIPPAEVRRIDFERIECPMCGEQFAPNRKR
jgi:ribosomal protein S27AE